MAETSKVAQVLAPYQGDIEILTSYIPKELSDNPEAYLAMIVGYMTKANQNAGPRVGDLLNFMYQINRTNLDPMSRQIYAVYRQGMMSVQTSIDGFRLVAARSGFYGGSDDTTFEPESGTPSKATQVVYLLNPHSFERMPVVASARMSEYRAGGPMWTSKPFLMLGKCAEALALRKAFPQELSGLYTTDEMDQAENRPAATFNRKDIAPTNEAKQAALDALTHIKHVRSREGQPQDASGGSESGISSQTTQPQAFSEDDIQYSEIESQINN